MKTISAGFTGLVLLAAGEASGYPIARERELGERFALEAGSQLPIVREPAVVDFVNRFGRRIVDRLGSPQPFDYRFHAVDDAQLNAFAVPGGFVYVNTGLLTRVANDAELAGVLGHEIAHVHAHHIVRQQEKSALASYATLAGVLLSTIHPAIGAAALGTGAAAQLKYLREFEQEADYLGLRFMREAGFDARGMASFMKRVAEEQRTNPVELPPYLLSHPMTDERITHLEAATRDSKPEPGWEQPSADLERAQTVIRAVASGRAGAREEPPGEGRALALHGLTLLYQGDAAAAAKALEKARVEGAENVERDLGLARLRTGDVDGAILLLRGRIEAAPGDSLSRATLGAALVAKGEYAAAREELARALKEAPYLDQAENDLGQAYGRAGDQGRGFFHLARAFELRSDVERALAHYEKARKLLPPDSGEAAEAEQKIETLGRVTIERVIGRRR